MKTRITAILLTVCLLFSAVSLTSCVMLEDGIFSGDTSEGGDINQNVTVEGGDSYDVTIENPATSNVVAASKAMLSAVSVVATFQGQSSGIFGTSSSSAASGSGVIYRLNKEMGEAYILTNHHVVYDSAYGISKNIDVYLYGQEAENYELNATYVGGSLYYDLAVLKVTGSTVLMSSNAVAATFADSDKLAVLDTVIAVGNAEGNGISATVGYVNVDSEYIEMLGADEKTQITLRVIRTDAAVNPGNSGGGLFNTSGEVVGIVNAKSADDSIDNIGFAIPSNVAKSIAENIIYYCDGTNKTNVYRCLLGIEVTSQNYRTEYDLETGKIYKLEDVVVHSTTAGSAAAEVLKVGDIIRSISVDGKVTEVTRRHHVVDCMLDARDGSTIVFTLVRDGVEVSATITATSDMLKAYS